VGGRDDSRDNGSSSRSMVSENRTTSNVAERTSDPADLIAGETPDISLSNRAEATLEFRPMVEVDGRFYLKQSRIRLAAQRAFDLVLLIVSLILVVPIFLAIAVMIKVDSTGPVFFQQERVGMNRKRFMMWKFRKMRDDLVSPGPMVTVRHDRRLTSVGAMLERTKLDELPQLINVLNGTMSVVGPRPEVPRFIEHFPEDWDVVLSVRPGIFGASQNFFRNESELYPPTNVEEFYLENILPEMLELDKRYAQNPGLIKDIGLLLQGVFASVFGAITRRTVVMRRSQVASFFALALIGVGSMIAALQATGQTMSSLEVRRAILLAAIANPLVIVLLRIPKAVATSMTFTDLRRLLWAAVASTALIAFGMWGFHDLHQLGLTLVLDMAFFLSSLFVYKLTVYSIYLTFFVQDSRVFARRTIFASMVFGPLSVLLVVSLHHGPEAWFGVEAGKHITTLVLALLVRPLVALHFRSEPFHPGNTTRLRAEVGRLVLATIAGSSTILLGIILVSRQTPAFIDLLLDGAVFLLLFTLFALRESVLFAPQDAGDVPAATAHTRSKMIVIGSGIELLAYIASLDGIPEHDFIITGVVTPETSRRLSTVGGHRVLGDTSDLTAILETSEVDQVVVLESSLDRIRLASVEAVTRAYNCEYFPIRLFPGDGSNDVALESTANPDSGPFRAAAALREILSAEPR
jgi:lipopolysaccharide/colanic/teichoic acid biosynthesis glycosyltransferase